MVMSIVTKDEVRADRMYLALMEEAKTRIHIVNGLYHNKSEFPVSMVRELCYLQYRFLCEIIALACLVIHGDIKKTKALREEYDAAKILKQMSGLKRDFFPHAVLQQTRGKYVHFIDATDCAPITKDEVINLWRKSGDKLHRGKMVNLGRPELMVVGLLTKTKSAPETFPDLFLWSGKISCLLRSHWITLTKTDRKIKAIFVTLKSPDTPHAKASVMVFDKDAPIKATGYVKVFKFSTESAE